MTISQTLSRKLVATVLFCLLPYLYFSQTIRYQNSLKGGLTVATNSLALSSVSPLNTAPAAGITVSSSSNLVLPAGSTIIKAILYVEKYINLGPTTALTSCKFRVPGGTYTTLTTASPGFIANPIVASSYTQFIIDVTSLMSPTGFTSTVTAGGSAANNYSVADPVPFNSDNYGVGWTLMVVYANNASKLRNITIADACSAFGLGASTTINIPNVSVPAIGPVTAIVAVTGCWGEDGGVFNDNIRFGQSGGTLTALADPTDGGTNDALNSTIGFTVPNNVTVDGVVGMAAGTFVGRNPYNTFATTPGGAPFTKSSFYFDSDIFNATGMLPGSATPITAQLVQQGSINEAIGGGAYGISVDIVPAVLTKSLSPPTILCDGTATYTFTITNTDPGSNNQTGLGFTDNIPSGLTIDSPNGVVITGGTGGTVTAVPGTNTFTLSGFNLNAGQTATITLNVTNVSGMLNPSCGSNPAAFTNGPTNIVNNTPDLANAVTPQCLVINAGLIPTFNSYGPYCQGVSPGILPTSSTNSPAITGTWSPATISTATVGSTNYTFTPNPGQCSVPITITVVVNAATVPNHAGVGPFCQGATGATFSTTSPNGVTGTWSPSATVSTATVGSTTYTFTPNAGQCGTPQNITVAVTAPVLPTFNPIPNYCVGDSPATLQTTSNNGYAGTWSPSTISTATAGSTTYTFMPNAGVCATSATITVTVGPPTTPTFASVGPFCQASAGATLPNTSTNGYTGTWSPSATVNTSTPGTFTYTFTPTAGQCATNTTMSITIDPSTFPTFTQVGPFCQGDPSVTLPSTSNNGFSGVWTATDVVSTTTAGSTVYTFTPPASSCATTTMTIVVNAVVTPTFNTIPPYCVGDSPATLNTTSNNGITGTWSPSTISTASSGSTSYTFTPTAGVCATPVTITVSVGPPATPIFTAAGPFCQGATPTPLPTTSNNGVNGTWAPATISTATVGSSTYTFTPNAGVCATSTTMNVVINAPITPSFAAVGPYCQGTAIPPLPTTSTNGFTGSWSPAINNTVTTTYTFTPTAGQCATTTTITIVVSTSITPTFNPIPPYCVGDTPATLPTTSNNSVNGTWSPSTISTASTGSTNYTFTPTSGACATPLTITVSVGPPATPTFTQEGPFCQGDPGVTLPTLSNNGVNGTWVPATISTATAGSATYTFTPNAGVCATNTTMTVLVNATPVATANSNSPVCEGQTLTFTGTPGGATYQWSGPNSFAPTIQNPSIPAATTLATGTYTLIATVNGCASLPVTVNATVNPIPTVSVNSPSTCPNIPVDLTASGATTYLWSPATGLSATSGSTVTATVPSTTTYTVLGTTAGCSSTATATVTINSGLSIDVTPPSDQICAGTSTTLTASGGTTYTWTPATGLNTTTGATVIASPATTTVYTVTGNTSGCTGTENVTIIIKPIPTANPMTVTPVCNGATVTVPMFGSTPPGATFTWTNSDPSIGLGASGTGTISAFTGVNTGSTPVTATVSYTPTLNGCTGTAGTTTITINPIPTVTAANNGPLCQGQDLNLTASTVTGAFYNWTGPNGFGSGLEDPTITAVTSAAAGIYTVTINLNGCTSSSSTTLVINPNLFPSVNGAGPFCIDDATPVTLTSSIPGGTWSGTGITDAVAGTFVPSSATVGTNTITYTVTSGCGGVGTGTIIVNPLPNVNFVADNVGGCSPVVVNFSADPSMANSTWDFGDGTTPVSSVGAVQHTFSFEGCYTITLTNTQTGCSNTASQANYICVLPEPNAVFFTNQNVAPTYAPSIQFFNQSTNALSYEWYFGDGATATDFNTQHDYAPNIGTYTVTLYAYSAGGCVDSTSKTITIEQELLAFVPNTFTPDGDEHNNVFVPVFTEGFDPYDFSMIIFNRWGETIFETNDATKGWDGTYHGKLVQEGVYTWKIRTKSSQNDRIYSLDGHVFLIR